MAFLNFQNQYFGSFEKTITKLTHLKNRINRSISKSDVEIHRNDL